jgi:hypothetical protein
MVGQLHQSHPSTISINSVHPVVGDHYRIVGAANGHQVDANINPEVFPPQAVVWDGVADGDYLIIWPEKNRILY